MQFGNIYKEYFTIWEGIFDGHRKKYRGIPG